VITSNDQANATISTLYGNDAAVGYARTSVGKGCPEVLKLALVTCARPNDDRYFGTKLPNAVPSAEFLFVEAGNDGHPGYYCERSEGTPLRKESDLPAFTSNEPAA
jgi:hypothetical protein